MLLQGCFFSQQNYAALYNRMAVLFIAKSTAILKFYYVLIGFTQLNEK